MKQIIIEDEDAGNLLKKGNYKLESNITTGFTRAVRNNQVSLALEYLTLILDVVFPDGESQPQQASVDLGDIYARLSALEVKVDSLLGAAQTKRSPGRKATTAEDTNDE